MVGVDGNNAQLDLQPKSCGLVQGSEATWHWVCIRQVNRVNVCNGYAMTTAPSTSAPVLSIIITVFLYKISGSTFYTERLAT